MNEECKIGEGEREEAKEEADRGSSLKRRTMPLIETSIYKIPTPHAANKHSTTTYVLLDAKS